MLLANDSGAKAKKTYQAIYIAFNVYWETLEFTPPPPPPPPPKHTCWHRLVDTALSSPHDICEHGQEVPLATDQSYAVLDRSVVILVAS